MATKKSTFFIMKPTNTMLRERSGLAYTQNKIFQKNHIGNELYNIYFAHSCLLCCLKHLFAYFRKKYSKMKYEERRFNLYQIFNIKYLNKL